MAPKVLLLGKNGQVGWELQGALAGLGEVVALGRSELDLRNVSELRSRIRDVQPDLVINAAAYTAVDKAESERDLAMAVNGTAPGILAEEADRLGAAFIHYSTDYVFDGSKDRPYKEEDSPNPVNWYGDSKLAGERGIEAVGGAYLILRTSWIYSLRRECFVTKLLRWSGERPVLRVVDDQVSVPTWCRTVAQATAGIISRGLTGLGRFIAGYCGTYHLASSGSASRFEWAKSILALHYGSAPSSGPELEPLSSREFAGTAQRPAYSVLDCGLAQDTFGIALPNWREDLTSAFQSESAPSPQVQP